MSKKKYSQLRFGSPTIMFEKRFSQKDKEIDYYFKNSWKFSN